jgi:hypothetical protein
MLQTSFLSQPTLAWSRSKGTLVQFLTSQEIVKLKGGEVTMETMA